MNKRLISLAFVVTFVFASAFASNAAQGTENVTWEGVPGESRMLTRAAQPQFINMKDITRILSFVVPEMKTRATLPIPAGAKATDAEKDTHKVTVYDKTTDSWKVEEQKVHAKLKHDDQIINGTVVKGQYIDVAEQDHIPNFQKNNNAIVDQEIKTATDEKYKDTTYGLPTKKVTINKADDHTVATIVNSKVIGNRKVEKGIEYGDDWVVRIRRGEPNDKGEGAVYEDYHITLKGYFADDTDLENPKRYIVNEDGTKEPVYSFDRTLNLYGKKLSTSYREYKDAGIELKRNPGDTYVTKQSIAYNEGKEKPYYSMGSAYYFGLFDENSAKHDILGFGIATRVKRWSRWNDLSFAYESQLIPYPCKKNEYGVDDHDKNGNLIPVANSNWYEKGAFNGCVNSIKPGAAIYYDQKCSTDFLREKHNLVFNENLGDYGAYVYAE